MNCRDYEDVTTLHRLNEVVYADPLGERCHSTAAIIGLDWMLDHYKVIEPCPNHAELFHVQLKSEAYDITQLMEGAGDK